MKTLKMAILSTVVGMGLLLAGCGAEEPQAVAIQEGVDKCEICHMHVPDDYNATQILLKDGRTLKFDDIGCMNEWVSQNGVENINIQFVRDYNTEEWFNAEQGAFVYDSTLTTPMGYGIYSFKEAPAAEKFIQDRGKGTLMKYDDLAKHSWERNMSHDHAGHDNHGSHEGSSSTHGGTDSQHTKH